MGPSHKFPSFSCELRIIQAQNVEFNSKGKGNLFTSVYLSAGTNKRIQVNTRKISTTSLPFWNESFCLDCSCSQEFLETLKQESLVLEVRQGNTVPVLGKILGSRLLGRAEIPWKVVFESPNSEFKEWVKMDLENGNGFKPIKLQVEIKVHQVPSASETTENKMRRRSVKKWVDYECGCKEFGHDHGIFVIAADLEAF